MIYRRSAALASGTLVLTARRRRLVLVLLLHGLSIVGGLMLGGMLYFASKLVLMGIFGFVAACGFGFLLDTSDPSRRRLAFRIDHGDVIVGVDKSVPLVHVEDVAVIAARTVDGDRRANVMVRVDGGESALLLEDVLHEDAVACAGRVRRFMAENGWNGRVDEHPV